MKIGWGDTFIPDFIYNIWWIMLLFAIIGAENGPYSMGGKTKIWTIIICLLSVGAVYMAMLLYCTPKGYTDCPSVGARYLIPVLLPFCVALRGKRIVITQGIPDKVFILGADLCQVVGVVYMFNGYLSR